MKPWPFLVLGWVALLPIACQKGKFSEDKASTESYEIKVVDPAGADAIATVEGPNGSDTKDSGDKAGAGDDSKETGDNDSADSGSDSDDAGEQAAGDGKDGIDKTRGQGSGKGSEKGSSGNGSNKDAGDCAAIAGVNKERVKVSGSQKSITLSPQDAFALKVTGNQNKVHLKMTADAPDARVSAICIFATGNQSHVTMDIGVSVGRIFIKARGNKALIEATVSKSGAIEALQVDANGNQPSIVMKGEGKYPCDSSSVSCEKP